jgi:hypothetical protein
MGGQAAATFFAAQKKNPKAEWGNPVCPISPLAVRPVKKYLSAVLLTACKE